LEKVKKKYDSEHEEIKVLNCISSRDHSDNQKICRALLDKVKISPNIKDNSTINVKRKILQIVPVFLSKATDYTLWEDITDKGSVVTAMQSGLRTCVTYVPETAPNTLSMVMSIEYGL
jgi:hypothetical protein